MKKQKAKGHKKSSNSKKRSNPAEQINSWVDEHLDWESNAENESSTSEISIVCWNVLADAYCSYKSHKHLPLKFQRHVFDHHQRQHHVRQILRRFSSTLAPDLMALQEVDPPLEVAGCMEELGYDGVETPTSPGGKDGRVDSCVLYYSRNRWACLEHQIIRLDDLATMCSKPSSGVPFFGRNNLQGVQTSFVRKNMALLVRLKNLHDNTQLVVAVLHLYWNPSYEYVKLCQVHHVMNEAKIFSKGAPFILCGDFNSQPNSLVHQYLVKGYVNAKLVAPWYFSLSLESEPYSIQNGVKSKDDAELLGSDMNQLSISNNGKQLPPPLVRYMLDFTLNRFCRWLRILGLDAALETEAEERLRTKEAKFTIFERCKLERRILVTTSTKSLQRKDCPPGTYLLDTKSLKNLEVTLVHLLLSHGVILEPKKFLSRCVVCNGSIERVHDEQQIQNIFATYAAPESLNEEILEVFQCSGCSQGYWWCDRPTSSASRVKSQATILLETCIRGGVPIEKDMAMFFFVDAEKVKQDTTEITEESRLLNQRLDVLEWLQDEKLKSAFGPMLSAYAIGEGDESLPFTNVTADFVGHLDYIMFQEKHLKVKDRLYVPTTFEELNGEDIHNGHLLPSNVWPSDHLAIGARFCYKSTSVGVEVANSSGELQQSSLVTKKESDGENEKRMAVSEVTNSALFCAPIQEGSYAPPLQTVPITHTSSLSCGCGCVPKIPSLFEMAELRKQARLKQKS